MQWRKLGSPRFVENVGKNVVVITPKAGRDFAVLDLGQSAFGHGAQKPSAERLVILVADECNYRRSRCRDSRCRDLTIW